MLWQLIPTESAVLEPIDLKQGALLLGRGQRASPGITDEAVAKIAARVHANADRVQVTAMANNLKWWRDDQPQKLGRGQSVLFQTGDLIDLSSSGDSSAPASEFTYMLAESLLETAPVAATAVMPKIKVGATSRQQHTICKLCTASLQMPCFHCTKV